jgi:hypothetical protein
MGKNYNSSRLVNGLSVDASGNVGVGGSASGSYKFEVTGTSKVSDVINAYNSDGNYYISMFNTSNSNKNWAIIARGNNIAIREAGVADQMTFAAGGNIGIGTSSPATKLEIVGSFKWGSSTNNIISSNDVGGVYMELSGTSTATRALRIQGANDAGTKYSAIKLQAGAEVISFETADAERMRISPTGNVGIGTNSPLNTLTLAGNSGYLTFLNTSADGQLNRVIGRIASQVRTYGTNISTNSFASIEFATDPSGFWYQGNIRFLTNGSDGTGGNPTERMRIRSNGNKTFNGPGGQDQMFSNIARTSNGEYIDIDTESGGGNFMGILIAQNNYAYNAGYRTQGIYAIVGRGTTISVTTITSVNGPTGSSALSITSPSTGIIRITNVGLYGDISGSWRGFV